MCSDLGRIKLLINYLDPDIETNSLYEIDINDLSPTSFYLLHGKKELIPPDILPNKYAYAFSLLGMPPKLRFKSMEQLAKDSLHHTPNSIEEEIKKMPADVPIYLGHLKPKFQDILVKEMDTVGSGRVVLLEKDGVLLEF